MLIGTVELLWGECSVAKCCQDKGYTHCGECPDIPCDILREFSCGNGVTIAICQAWAIKGRDK